MMTTNPFPLIQNENKEKKKRKEKDPDTSRFSFSFILGWEGRRFMFFSRLGRTS